MKSHNQSLREKQEKALLARLARIEGQIRGIRRMIEQQDNCENVAQQLSAARKALNKCFYEMVACAIRQDVIAENAEPPQDARDKLFELTRVLTKYG